MTGAITTLMGSGAGPGAGSTTISATNWVDLAATYSAANPPVTILGITVPVSITATKSSAGTLYYQLNGVTVAYTGAFNVRLNDLLAWQVNTVKGVTVAGTISVTNATTATLLQTFNYNVGGGW